KLPSSRPVWRLYRHLWGGARQPLAEALMLYSRRLEQVMCRNSRGVVEREGDEGPGSGGAPQETGGGGKGGGTPGEPAPRGLMGMLVYLVLERCSVLAEAGYTVQAVEEILAVLGAQPPEWWAGAGAGKRAAGEGVGKRPGEAFLLAQGGGGGQPWKNCDLPQELGNTIQDAPRPIRSLLWLTALHLLVFGVFPPAALSLVEGDELGGDPSGGVGAGMGEAGRGWGWGWDGEGGHYWPLVWPVERLAEESPTGRRLAACPHLQDGVEWVFLKALRDAGLSPSPVAATDAAAAAAADAKDGSGGGEGGVPRGSGWEGPTLLLALNRLAFCAAAREEGGRDYGKESLVWCRRFLLAHPPPDPALLDHLIFEYPCLIERCSRERHISQSCPGGSEGDGDGTDIRLWGKLYSFLCLLKEGREEEAMVRLKLRQGMHTGAEARTAAAAAAAAGAGEGAGKGVGAGAGAAYTAAREALIEFWTKSDGYGSARAAEAVDGDMTSSKKFLLWELKGKPTHVALEHAKRALHDWATGGCRGTLECKGWGPGRSSVSLAVIVLTLWALDSPASAVAALDHILTAESFSMMTPERRQVAWFHRVEAAAVMAESEAAAGEDSVDQLREAVLRALADERTRPRYWAFSGVSTVLRGRDPPPLTCKALGSLDDVTPCVPGSLTAVNARCVAEYTQDMLRVYASALSRGQRSRARVDWVVAEEVLSHPSGRQGRGGKPSSTSAGPSLALLRWAFGVGSRAGAGGGTAGTVATGATTLRVVRPHMERALTSNPGDPCLAVAVAALESESGDPAISQRVLEAALRRRPRSSALWEARVKLEAMYGEGSRERALAVAARAAASGVLLRLPCLINADSKARQACPAATSSSSSVGLNLPAPPPPPPSPPPPGTGPILLLVIPMFPLSILLLNRLVSLSVAWNGLRSLPSSVSRLRNLRTLDVTGNRLWALPASLGKLQELRVLRVASNLLVEILPNEVLAKLSELRVLDAEGNRLFRFPDGVLALKNLDTLKLARNPFVTGSPVVGPSGLNDALPLLRTFTPLVED
ncbi:unnamed protein product, partial [Discosporangium mesarthrocarpum]